MSPADRPLATALRLLRTQRGVAHADAIVDEMTRAGALAFSLPDGRIELGFALVKLIGGPECLR